MRNLIIGICLGIAASCSAVKIWKPGDIEGLTMIPDTVNGGLMYPYCGVRNKIWNDNCKDPKYKKVMRVPIKGNSAVRNFVCKHMTRAY